MKMRDAKFRIIATLREDREESYLGHKGSHMGHN